MAIVELFSQRLKRERGEVPDPLQYDTISSRLRRQLLYAITDVYGPFSESYSGDTYASIVSLLRRELGTTHLSGDYRDTPGEEFENFITKTTEVRALDGLELAFRVISREAESDRYSSEHQTRCRDALREFNHRCRSANVGYAFEGGQLIRIDSQFLHAEAVKPALQVLAEAAFANADAEIRSAHLHWRERRHAEDLVDCLKAFERTLKIIAQERGWIAPSNATATQLIDLAFEKDLIPPFYKTHFSGVRSILQSGIPTPRNRVAGHGAGAAPSTPVPDELVRYVLHQTAATILFLVDSHKARP